MSILLQKAKKPNTSYTEKDINIEVWFKCDFPDLVASLTRWKTSGSKDDFNDYMILLDSIAYNYNVDPGLLAFVVTACIYNGTTNPFDLHLEDIPEPLKDDFIRLHSKSGFIDRYPKE